MARVYVSSTVADLVEERQAVLDAVRRLGHIPVVFTGDSLDADQRPLDLALVGVAAADLYVGIVGWRYGHVPPGRQESTTELEWREAVRLGKPVLAFLRGVDAPVPRSFVDQEAAGHAVERFRTLLAHRHVIAYFSGADDLRRQVFEALALWSHSAAVDRPVPVAVALMHARHDGRLVQQVVDRALIPLRSSGLVGRIDATPVEDGWTSDADITIWATSADLLSSLPGFFAPGATDVVLPLRPSLWTGVPELARLPILIGHGPSLSELRDREAALVQIGETVRSLAQAVQDRRVRSARPTTEVRDVHRLVEVFKSSGVPSLTFVEPEPFYRLLLALEQPGRGVVIEGPSGVGKTTALQTAVAQLDAGARQAFTILRARDPDDRARIADLARAHRGAVAIDDFHRLDADVRLRLVDHLKLLADTEPVDRKLVVVGIPGTGRRLVEIAPDIATRIEVIKLGTASDAKVAEMVTKGETALNVDLVHRAEIIRLAAGSLNVAQILCWHAVALAGVRETATTTVPVDTDVARTTAEAVAAVGPKFDTAVRGFAALDGPDMGIAIDLLGELATADGTLSLRELRDRRRELRAAVDHLMRTAAIETYAAAHPALGQVMLYDAVAASLVADDPQLVFYLRALNLKRLAAEVGKRPRSQRTRIFVSYSHQDAEWLRRLQVHLAPLEQRGIVDIWADTRIAVGQLWRDEIEEALESASAAVLLVSSDFLASSFVRDHELPPLLESADRGGCRILTVPVRPSLLAVTPELSRFEAVCSPDTPLSGMGEADMETVLVGLARSIADLVAVR